MMEATFRIGLKTKGKTSPLLNLLSSSGPTNLISMLATTKIITSATHKNRSSHPQPVLGLDHLYNGTNINAVGMNRKAIIANTKFDKASTKSKKFDHISLILPIRIAPLYPFCSPQICHFQKPMALSLSR